MQSPVHERYGYFICRLHFCVCVYLGVTANIFNIVAHAITNVRDNITVSFLALSTSDLFYLVFLSSYLIAEFLLHFVQNRFEKSIKWLTKPKIFIFPFYWYAFVFYETSILIIVYISVARCVCVA